MSPQANRVSECLGEAVHECPFALIGVRITLAISIHPVVGADACWYHQTAHGVRVIPLSRTAHQTAGVMDTSMPG